MKSNLKTATKNHFRKVYLLLFSLLISGSFVFAQNWPQWRGPNRDGKSPETGLKLDWTEKKPPLLWSFREAGAGYSSPTIQNGILYCQGAANGDDFAFALEAESGKLIWKQRLGDEFVMDRGNGPRGSVTIDSDKLYLVRGGGQIHCITAKDGKTLWQKDFRKDLAGEFMSQWDWGYSESPLVDGNLVICTPGGNQGAVAALDKNTGEVVWRSTGWTDPGGYSSPIVADVDGVRQYIQFAKNGVAGIAAKDGKLLWNVNYAGNRVAVIPTPIYFDNMVYATSGYNAGCAGIKLKKDGEIFRADTMYVNRGISNHHGGVVLVDGHIYGYSDGPGWVCQNLATGQRVWQYREKDSPGKGAVLYADGHLLCLGERTGTLVSAIATTEGWKANGQLEIPERSTVPSMDKMVWTHPVIANGKLYMRDHDLLFCFDLKN